MAQLDDAQRQQILTAIQQGRKLEAIKLYRDFTREGLKEAKDFIEELSAQLGDQIPGAVSSQKSGCSVSVLVVVGVCSLLLFR